MKRTMTAISATSLALCLAGCGQGEDDRVDTTFESQASAPVAVDTASPEQAEPNAVGDTQDDVVVEGQGGRPSDNMVNKEVSDSAPPPAE